MHLLDKLAIEKKNILMDDFNVDLLHYETHSQRGEFLDKIFSASLSPHITIPTRVTPRNKTLINIIFTNGLDDNSNCGNCKFSSPDHLAQFLIYSSKPVKFQKHGKREI